MDFSKLPVFDYRIKYDDEASRLFTLTIINVDKEMEKLLRVNLRLLMSFSVRPRFSYKGSNLKMIINRCPKSVADKIIDLLGSTEPDKVFKREDGAICIRDKTYSKK